MGIGSGHYQDYIEYNLSPKIFSGCFVGTVIAKVKFSVYGLDILIPI